MTHRNYSSHSSGQYTESNGYCYFGWAEGAELPACDTVVDEGKPGFGIRRGWEIIVLGPLYGTCENISAPLSPPSHPRQASFLFNFE